MEIKTQLYLINRQASTDCKSIPSAFPSHWNNLATNYYRTLIFLQWSEGFQKKDGEDMCCFTRGEK